MWTAISGSVISRRGARLRDAVRLRAARVRARARTGDPPTADTRTAYSVTPGAIIVWRHCDKHATTRPHFDVWQRFRGQEDRQRRAVRSQALTMAHRTLPFGTRVRVTNLENQRSVEVVVNDRGPFVAGRIADLSEAAARRIGMIADGVVEALLDILQEGQRR